MGKRGKPKGYMSPYVAARRRLHERWLENIQKFADAIFMAQLDAALGHFYEQETAEGNVRIYRKSPNPQSIEWILEHLWGKARQQVDLEATLEVKRPELTPETELALKAAVALALPNYAGKVIDAPVPEISGPGKTDEQAAS